MGNKPRRYTHELLTAQSEGKVIVESFMGNPAKYEPRFTTDHQPWVSNGIRYSGRECHAVDAPKAVETVEEPRPVKPALIRSEVWIGPKDLTEGDIVLELQTEVTAILVSRETGRVSPE